MFLKERLSSRIITPFFTDPHHPILLNPFLSIILPAHNEAERLPETLEKIDEFLRTQDYTSEVLVVENGSSDNTLELARSYLKRFPYLKVIHENERGKGLAVRRGMLESTAKFRFICDVDLSMPLEQINQFLPPVLPNSPIAIASREAPGSIRYDEPEYRHFVGRVFNTLVRLIALPDLQDTQCGFKCFREDTMWLFDCQTIAGWTFDVEVLFAARKNSLPIVEVPIPWYFDSHSKVRVVRDSLQMGFDLIKIRFNALRGRYKYCGPS
jgi:glycosyltransferase involved in cell wall biosynthesis